MKDVTNHDDVAFFRAFGGEQPQGKCVPPLVSGFKSVIELVEPKHAPDRIKDDEWLIPATVSSNSAVFTVLRARLSLMYFFFLLHSRASDKALSVIEV